MGVYPSVEYRDVNTGQLLSASALVYRDAWYEIGTLDHAVYYARLVVADRIWSERQTCFCCTCDDRSSDPYCRNHGFAGERPCETHEQPGQRDEHGVMPASVQAHRKEHDERVDTH